MRITVHVAPRSSVNAVVARSAIEWRVKVTSSPTDGEANAAICRVIAEELDVAPSRVRVYRGHTSRTKIIEVS